MGFAELHANPFFEIVEALTDGRQFLPVQCSGLLRQVLKPINLPSAALDESLTFVVGHRVEILRESEHICSGYKGLLKWSYERQSRIADHAKAEVFSQAKSDALGSRRGQGCDISAGLLLQSGHAKRWCIVPILNAKSGKLLSGFFTAELCSGDLSIRITSSMGGGRNRRSTPTY